MARVSITYAISFCLAFRKTNMPYRFVEAIIKLVLFLTAKASHFSSIFTFHIGTQFKKKDETSRPRRYTLHPICCSYKITVS